MTIGENVKKYRKKRGMSQKDLALVSGLTATTIGKIENGTHKKPKNTTMEKLSNALGVSVERLKGEESEPSMKESAFRLLKEASKKYEEVSEHLYDLSEYIENLSRIVKGAVKDLEKDEW